LKRVLVVDDEPGLALLVRAFLESADVSQSPTIPEAVAAAREQRPAVVLLDLDLAGDDGMEWMSVTAGDAELKEVPVIIFSVHDSRFDEARKLGAVGCVRKPFKGADLRSMLAPYLDDVPVSN
jgi:DNA-binding response OmpR family regulator